MPGDFMFDVFPIFFAIVFVLIFSVIIFVIVKGISQWNKNNHSPRLSTDATIVSKRENISHRSSNGNMMGSTSTTYYVTFQVPSGDRMELLVSGIEYGMLVEGDRGTLAFQGTRYLSFMRQ